MQWNRNRNRRLPANPKMQSRALQTAGRRPGRQILAAAAVALALLTVLKLAGPLPRLEWLAGDCLQRLDASGRSPLPDLRFVVLDQRSLDAGESEFGLSWPWPRESYARVIRYLQQSGARLIFLDFLFTEPSLYGPADDQTLADALRAAGNVYLPVLVQETKRNSIGAMEAAAATRDRLRREQPRALTTPAGAPAARNAHGVSLPVAPILAAAAGVGEARFIPDADGVLRRLPPFTAVGTGYLPALGLAPLAAGEGVLSLKADRLRLGRKTWPLDGRGNLALLFPGTWRSYPSKSIIDVITSSVAVEEGREPDVSVSTFRDKVVIIGSVAEGLRDLRQSPLDSQTPGFFMVAAAWAAGDSGRVYDERWRNILGWALLVLLAGLGAWWGSRAFLRGAIAAAVTLTVFLGAALLSFRVWGVVQDVVAPSLGLLAAYGFSLGLAYRRERKQKNFIQGAFTQVLSPSVLEGLMRDPRRLSAGGELAELTVYFSDLAGFTCFSEKLNPHALVDLLNTYLGEMIDTIVEEQDGYVDKFIGDAVMAFWNAPLPEPDHALRACFAALRNQEKLRSMQMKLRGLGLDSPLRMRVGIHTGPAVVGMMGSPKKLNYTVIGDTVNLASRLEGVNKQYGTEILISGETLSRVQGRVVTREVDRIRVKGKTQPTRLFELVGLPGLVPEAQMQFLHVCQEASERYFHSDFKAALARLEEAIVLCPEDQPSRILRDRCRQYLQQPPPPDWDGVTTLRSK